MLLVFRRGETLLLIHSAVRVLPEHLGSTTVFTPGFIIYKLVSSQFFNSSYILSKVLFIVSSTMSIFVVSAI